jgi:hypothetical protein
MIDDKLVKLTPQRSALGLLIEAKRDAGAMIIWTNNPQSVVIIGHQILIGVVLLKHGQYAVFRNTSLGHSRPYFDSETWWYVPYNKAMEIVDRWRKRH